MENEQKKCKSIRFKKLGVLILVFVLGLTTVLLLQNSKTEINTTFTTLKSASGDIDYRFDTEKLNLKDNKQRIYKSLLIKTLKQKGLLLEETDEALMGLWNKDTEIIKDILATVMEKNSATLFPGKIYPNPLTYILGGSGEIAETTTASYYPITPIGYYKNKLDFFLLIPTNFGLRTYLFDYAGKITKKFGAQKTAFYSVTYEKQSGVMAMSIPGLYCIYFVENFTSKKISVLSGYSPTAVHFYEGVLFFAGPVEGQEWNQSAVFSYDPATKRVTKLTKEIFADVRGLAVDDNYLYVSDGAHHRIVIFDRNSWLPIKAFTGFRYPNNISLTSRGTLLVADEHADCIRELILPDFEELRATPVQQLRSPGSAIEISQGKYKGSWLIADTDQQRVILVNPDTWEILAEITGLRSTLKAIPIFLD